jgi:hypothetical protein
MLTPSPHMLIPQQIEISCSAACLATVAAILGVEGRDYPFFRPICAPAPVIGLPCAKLADIARTYLPVTTWGEGVYAGGLAIAGIRDATDEGHYVVFLGQVGDEVVYYDPYLHGVVKLSVEELKWITEDEGHQEWCINFNAPDLPHPFVWTKFTLGPAPDKPPH